MATTCSLASEQQRAVFLGCLPGPPARAPRPGRRLASRSLPGADCSPGPQPPPS